MDTIREKAVFTAVFLLMVVAAKADYTSKSNYNGSFEATAAWVPSNYGEIYPNTNGNVSQQMTIAATSVITRNGNLNPVTTIVYGKFYVKGSYTNSQWSGLTVKSNAYVEIFGDLTGAAGISVESGGVLIVHGNLASTGSSVSIKGDVVVLGNFSTSSGTTVSGNGNLVVGGNFSHLGGGLSSKSDNLYILDPDAVINAPNWSDVSKGNYGDMSDFLSNEAGNTSLIDLVADLGLVVTTYTWNGTSSDWSNTANWTNGKVPTSGNNVVVQSGGVAPVINPGTLVSIKNLTINSGATLTLKAGGKLSVEGTLTNNGSMVLEHSTTTPSSFIYKGTEKVPNVTLKERIVGESLRKWYMGHVIEGAAYSNYSSVVASPVSSNLAIASYNTPGWTNLTSGVLDTPMKGYGVQIRSKDLEVSHTGNLMAGTDYTYSFGTKVGYHLVANPYPAYVDLASYTTQWDFSNVDKTIWYFTGYGTSRVFAAYNLATGISTPVGVMDGYVAPMQGFFVKNGSAGTTFGVKAGARVHGLGGPLKSAATSSNDVLRIRLSNNVMSDETVLVYRSIGTESFNKDLDSEKLFETVAQMPVVYSVKDGKQLAVNLMPEDPTPYSIPVALTVGAAGAGTLTLNAFNIGDFMPDVEVWLLDKVTGVTVNLRDKPQYSFETAAVSAFERFELTFKRAEKASQITTAIGSSEIVSGVVTAIGVGPKTIVRVKDAAFTGKVLIELLDGTGKTLVRQESNTERTELAAPVGVQFYLVRVTYADKAKTFKIMNVGR